MKAFKVEISHTLLDKSDRLTAEDVKRIEFDYIYSIDDDSEQEVKDVVVTVTEFLI